MTTKTKVNMISVTFDKQTKKMDGSVQTGAEIKYTVGGIEEVRNLPNGFLNHETNKAMKDAVVAIAAKVPIDVVLLEEPVPDKNYSKLLALLPGNTPEENPRQGKVKKPFTPYGNKGGYGAKDIKGMNRGVALKSAANVAASLGITTAQGVITLAREFEVYLNEKSPEEATATTTTTEAPKPALVF